MMSEGSWLLLITHHLSLITHHFFRGFGWRRKAPSSSLTTRRSCATFLRPCSRRKATALIWRRPARRDWSATVGAPTTWCSWTFPCRAWAARALHSPHHGRVGHGQGTHRPRHTHAEHARRQILRHGEFVEHPLGAPGVGTLRPHARRVHRRGRGEEGTV